MYAEEVKFMDVNSLDETLEVEILNVEHPSEIWIRPKALKPRYIEFEVSMATYYVDYNRGRQIDKYTELTIGKLCAVRMHMTIKRAIITSIDDDREYAVYFFIDEGYHGEGWTDMLYHLEKEFEERPRGAIQCGLVGIQPNPLEDLWTSEAKRFIEDSCLGEVVTARICGRYPENNTLRVRLTVGENDLNEDLVVLEQLALRSRPALRTVGF